MVADLTWNSSNSRLPQCERIRVALFAVSEQQLLATAFFTPQSYSLQQLKAAADSHRPLLECRTPWAQSLSSLTELKSSHRNGIENSRDLNAFHEDCLASHSTETFPSNLWKPSQTEIVPTTLSHPRSLIGSIAAQHLSQQQING